MSKNVVNTAPLISGWAWPTTFAVRFEFTLLKGHEVKIPKEAGPENFDPTPGLQRKARRFTL
jgi:hypothetical protein